jgi:hypothetical protein
LRQKLVKVKMSVKWLHHRRCLPPQDSWAPVSAGTGRTTGKVARRGDTSQQIQLFAPPAINAPVWSGGVEAKTVRTEAAQRKRAAYRQTRKTM